MTALSKGAHIPRSRHNRKAARKEEELQARIRAAASDVSTRANMAFLEADMAFPQANKKFWKSQCSSPFTFLPFWRLTWHVYTQKF